MKGRRSVRPRPALAPAPPARTGKHAEEEIRLREAAIASCTSAIALASLDGQVSWANEAFLELWGFESLEQVVGRHMSEFCDCDARVQDTLATLKDRGAWMGELTGRTRDGSLFDV